MRNRVDAGKVAVADRVAASEDKEAAKAVGKVADNAARRRRARRTRKARRANRGSSRTALNSTPTRTRR